MDMKILLLGQKHNFMILSCPLERQTCRIIDNILYHKYYSEKFSFRSLLLEQDMLVY